MYFHNSLIPIMFGTLKDNSLLINSLASNNCFSHRNIFQNGVNTLSKLVNHFLSKSSKMYSLDHTILFKVHQHVVQILIK